MSRKDYPMSRSLPTESDMDLIFVFMSDAMEALGAIHERLDRIETRLEPKRTATSDPRWLR